MDRLTKERFDRLARMVELDAPGTILGHMAISVAVRAFGFTSSMELARYIVEFHKMSVDYGAALLDPNSAESLEVAEIEKMMDDVDLDKSALEVAYEKS